MTAVVEKVRALLTKSRDAGCSEAEAEACMSRARKLMDEHGLEESALGEDGGGVGSTEATPKYLDPWRKVLARDAAAYYGCTTLFFGTDKRFLLVGREASRSVAQSMIAWLDELVLRLAREWRKSVGGTRGDQLNFERACGARIAQRLREMTAAATSVGEGGGTSLVLVRELQEAQAWMQERYQVRTTTARSKVEGAGAKAGREAGSSVGLGAQVGGGGSGRGARLLS